jgi:hypothetical protein
MSQVQLSQQLRVSRLGFILPYSRTFMQLCKMLQVMDGHRLCRYQLINFYFNHSMNAFEFVSEACAQIDGLRLSL